MSPDEVSVLLRRLLEAYTDFHADLEIKWRDLGGRVDWRIVASCNDQGKLVGRLASHIKALRYLVEELGVKNGVEYRIRLEDPKMEERLPDSGKKVPPEGYSPGHLMQLLYDVLVAILDAPPTITPALDPEADKNGWKFIINCARVQDYEKMVVPVEGDESNTTVLTALGTLFRAAGFRDGIALRLEVPERKK